MTTAPDIAAIARQWPTLTDAERTTIMRHVASLGRPWWPIPGPQQRAAESLADICVYGGAAGGGKTDLICGLSLTEHRRTLILRREKAQTDGIVQRLRAIVGHDKGLNQQRGAWELTIAGKDRLIEFGGLLDQGDEGRWQGRPHDLINLDELTEIREAQARFVMGWLRSEDPTQRCRVIGTCNPPTDVDGRWVFRFLAPWLDPSHANPAKEGELRWFTTRDDNPDHEVPDGRPFVWVDGVADYDYDRTLEQTDPEKVVRPKSRTFIAARVKDNPFYVASGYIAQLQSLPEPLRSRLLNGDWSAGVEDDPWQVIPTAWVEAAMARWKAPSGTERLPPMDVLGIDVARGGKDQTVLSARHGDWFATLIVLPGKDTPDGHEIVGAAIKALRDQATIAIDVVGVGASPYDLLRQARQHVYPVVAGATARALPKGHALRFANMRSQIWWQLREALDPACERRIALPPDRKLLADLTAPTWKPVSDAIQVASREDIIKRIGRSPDLGSAVVMALMDLAKRAVIDATMRGGSPRSALDHDPYKDIDRLSR